MAESMIAAPRRLVTPIGLAQPRRQRAALFGVGWASLSQVTGLAIRLASNLVLTRLLAPEAYGILGSALAVVTTLEWLSDLGIQPTLVRHERGEERGFLDAGWWLGLGRGCTLTALAAACAWPLSAFYGQPELLGVLLALALRPALMALRSPGLPVLRRRLDYRALFLDETTQTMVGTGVSLVLAWLWHSVWAIVAGTLAGAAAGIAISYYLCPHLPGRAINALALREIRHLGGQVFVNTLVMALWLNVDRLLGLRFVSAQELGLYMVAWNLAAVAEALITRVCDVHFSLLCRFPEGDERAAWHAKICSRAAGWGMPLLAGGVLLAPLTVRVLYDVRYLRAGVLFAVLLARLMFRALGQVEFQYLLSRGEVRLATRAYFVALIVQGACLAPLALQWGAMGLAACALASTAALTATQTFLMRWQFRCSLVPLVVATLWTAASLLGLWLLY